MNGDLPFNEALNDTPVAGLVSHRPPSHGPSRWPFTPSSLPILAVFPGKLLSSGVDVGKLGGNRLGARRAIGGNRCQLLQDSSCSSDRTIRPMVLSFLRPSA